MPRRRVMGVVGHAPVIEYVGVFAFPVLVERVWEMMGPYRMRLDVAFDECVRWDHVTAFVHGDLEGTAKLTFDGDDSKALVVVDDGGGSKPRGQ